MQRMNEITSVRPPVASLEVSETALPEFHNRYVLDTPRLTSDRFSVYEDMDSNRRRPVHGLDLLSVRSDPNVTMNDSHGGFPHIGQQNTAVVITDRSPLERTFVSTTKNLEETIAKVKKILEACYPSADSMVINEAVHTLFNTLEAVGDNEVESMEVEIPRAKVEFKIETNKGNRSNTRWITLKACTILWQKLR
jgi:hypothetical protein